MLVLKYLPNGNILAAPTESEDFKQIFRLRWEVLRKNWGQPEGTERDNDEYSSIHRVILKAENEDTLLACGRIQQTGENLAQIRYMAVDEFFRGQGLGSEVLKSLEDAAIGMKISTVFLNAREQAVHFYLQSEYRIEEEVSPFLGIRHFRMTKLLF
jgi:N-acetylglutamate synthase-like GNAT family acetyltransferase